MQIPKWLEGADNEWLLHVFSHHQKESFKLTGFSNVMATDDYRPLLLRQLADRCNTVQDSR